MHNNNIWHNLSIWTEKTLKLNTGGLAQLINVPQLPS
jgi:hypothetical protein